MANLTPAKHLTIMESFAKVLLILLPAIYFLIVVEAIYSYAVDRFNFRAMDTISSLSAGMTNAIKSVLGLTVVIIGYKYMYEHLAISQVKATWVTYVMALVFLDFGTYWYHRLAHSVNIFWNRHVIHHSGETFNIATALRQSISKFVNVSVFFFLPAAVLGVPPQVIAIVTPFHLFIQVWYHTTHIGKLGWLEYIIVTPSQHRVHHAINPIYIDKNLSPVFCIWDRMFGTFQEELDDVPCVYGVTRQVNTWNPIRINLMHLWLLIRDAWYTKSWIDRLRIWFMPTGWRPEDVKSKMPVSYASIDTFTPYDSKPTRMLIAWSWFQFVMLSIMTFHLLLQIATIGQPEVFYYGAFLFLMVYSYTTLMDRDKNAVWLELFKSAVGIFLIWHMGSWFDLDGLLSGGTIAVFGYLIVSAAVTAYLVKFDLELLKNVTGETAIREA